MQQRRRGRLGSLPSSAAKQCGAQLRRFREQAGLTREALATKVRYSPEAIKKYEYGERIPPLDAVNALAHALALEAEQRAALHAAAQLAREAVPDEARRPRVAWPPLVGRTAERAVLGRHMRGEGPPVLLLAGEPGIGKSRLLEETERLAPETGWRVLRGGCTRRSGQEPYAPLVGALASSLAACSPALQRRDLQGCAWLVRLLPELAEARLVPAPTWTLPPEQERRLLFAAVGRYLANVAGPAGTVLLLDDLQWAGGDVLDLLLALAHAGGPVALRVLGAYRSTEVHAGAALADMLADLAREGLAEQLTLAPLSEQESAALLEGLTHALGTIWGEELTEQVVRLTGGVPYFLVSCAQAVHSGHDGDGQDGQGSIPISWNVSESIRQRVAHLPRRAQQLIRLVAVVGREVEATLLLDLAARWGWQKPQTLAALEAASQARLLVEADGPQGCRFAHDLVREVVIGDLSRMRRADLHLQVAQALERVEGPSEPARTRRNAELAWHFLEAGARARALPYALRAGDQAEAVFAHAEAEKHYRTALEWAGELGDRRHEAAALEKLTTLLEVVTRYDEALKLSEQARAIYHAVGDLEGEGRAVCLLCWLHFDLKWLEPTMSRLAPLVEDLCARGLSVAGQARLYSILARIFVLTGQVSEEGDVLVAGVRHAVEVAEQAIKLAQAAKDDALRVQALDSRALALGQLGREEDAVKAWEAAVLLAEAAGVHILGARASANAQSVYICRGEFDTSQRYIERAFALVERTGHPVTTALVLLSRGIHAYYTGDWVKTRADFEQAVAAMRAVETTLTFSWPPLYLGALCLVEGQWEIADIYLGEPLALAERQHDLLALRPVRGIVAERDLLDGRAAAARAYLEPLLDRPGLQESQVQFVLPQLAWAYLDLGDEQRAGTLAAQSCARAVAHRHQLFLVDALRVQALIAIRQARWQKAQDALEESLALCRAMPYPYAEAKALYAYGQMHAANGEPELAHEQYEAALSICARLGEGLYQPHIERALAELSQR